MLVPTCSRCGCALDALVDSKPCAVVVPPPPMSEAATRALRGLGVLTGGLALYAAARLGLEEAGPAGGLIAIGAGGFLLLPFVPERLGARSVR
jgi:hypothetical protein